MVALCPGAGHLAWQRGAPYLLYVAPLLPLLYKFVAQPLLSAAWRNWQASRRWKRSPLLCWALPWPFAHNTIWESGFSGFKRQSQQSTDFVRIESGPAKMWAKCNV